jgi:S-DNA-T family DNA segregation ATPase FtsK/SpoIIIE
MKLILIDPKQLELTLYAKLPHLIMPVVTNAKEASLAFLWAVQEMEKRYSILKEFGVRNIVGFNDKLKKATSEMITKIHHLYPEGEEDNYHLPYLVLIVDEFADLMHTKAGKEIEANVCRLAQKARAAGIHIVLATQRPSVDVVTGLIKNNFPSRVSFRVTTSIDSRTILNKIGAEKLLGRGDMLFRSEVDINRVHSPYVDENEIEVLTDKLSTIPTSFRDDAIDFLNGDGELDRTSGDYIYGSHISGNLNGHKDRDELYDEAVRTVIEHRSASASMLQRRLNIGYNRAANLVESMESDGVVGPAQGSKPRKVLVAAD